MLPAVPTDRESFEGFSWKCGRVWFKASVPKTEVGKTTTGSNPVVSVVLNGKPLVRRVAYRTHSMLLGIKQDVPSELSGVTVM